MAVEALPLTRWLSRISPRSVLASWPVVCTGVVITVLALVSLTATAAARAVPQNDDWSYMKSAMALATDGRLELHNWAQMFLLGQVVTAQPLLWVFGARPATLKLYGAVAVAGWLICVSVVGRRCVGDRRTLLLVMAIACWPGLALISSSFMTDGPSAAASLLALVAGIGAIRRQSRFLMVGCLAAGLLAFTIREQTVVSVVAVTAGAWLARGTRRRFRIELTAGAGVLIVVCAALERLRHQMVHADLPPFGFDTLDLHRLPPSLLPCLFTVGLAVSPLALWNVLTLRRRDLTDPGRVTGWLLGLLALGATASWHFSPFPTVTLTNYITPSGAFPSAVVGQAPPVIGTGAWCALQVLAMVGGVCLAGEAVARLRRMRNAWHGWRAGNTTALIMTLYTLLLVAFVVGLSFGGQRQFDRYLIPLFPGAGLLLLRPASGGALAARRALLAAFVGGATVLLAATSLVVALSVNTRDAAIWDAAATLQARGVPSTTINAGFSWNGYHASTALDRHWTRRGGPTYPGQTWINRFPRSRDCYVVSVSQLSGPQWKLLTRRQHRPYGFGGAAVTTYTYRHETGRSPARAQTPCS